MWLNAEHESFLSGQHDKAHVPSTATIGRNVREPGKTIREASNRARNVLAAVLACNPNFTYLIQTEAGTVRIADFQIDHEVFVTRRWWRIGVVGSTYDLPCGTTANNLVGGDNGTIYLCRREPRNGIREGADTAGSEPSRCGGFGVGTKPLSARGKSRPWTGWCRTRSRCGYRLEQGRGRKLEPHLLVIRKQAGRRLSNE